jgi:hypothetical protein
MSNEERFRVVVNPNSDLTDFIIGPSRSGLKWGVVKGLLIPDTGMSLITFKNGGGSKSISFPVTGRQIVFPSMFVSGLGFVSSHAVADSLDNGDELQVTTTGVSGNFYLDVTIFVR